MTLPSVVHNSNVRTPVNFEPGLLRASPISPPIDCPRWVRFRFTAARTHSSYPGGYKRGRGYYSAAACSRKTEHEESPLTSKGETTSSPSHNGVNDAKRSHNTSSSGNSQWRKEEPKNHVSSARTAALCVFSAVAFGVGLGFKDGVGKASEFFLATSVSAGVLLSLVKKSNRG